MANVDRPNGLTPVRHTNGSPWNGKFRMYYHAVGQSDVIYMNDAVTSAGSADALGKYATVEQADVGDPIRGVAIGFSDTPYLAADTTNLERSYCPTLTAMYIAVVDDPTVIWEIQEDNAGENIEADDVGSVLNLVATAGSTTTGLSGMELDSSEGGSTSAKTFMLLGLVDREDNVMGLYARWEVYAVEHEFHGTAGI